MRRPGLKGRTVGQPVTTPIEAQRAERCDRESSQAKQVGHKSRLNPLLRGSSPATAHTKARVVVA